MRMQVELNDRGVALVNKIKQALNPEMSHRELFDNAICLLDWSIQQLQQERTIVSYNKKENSYRELAMPALSAVKPVKSQVGVVPSESARPTDSSDTSEKPKSMVATA